MYNSVDKLIFFKFKFNGAEGGGRFFFRNANVRKGEGLSSVNMYKGGGGSKKGRFYVNVIIE